MERNRLSLGLLTIWNICQRFFFCSFLRLSIDSCACLRARLTECGRFALWICFVGNIFSLSHAMQTSEQLRRSALGGKWRDDCVCFCVCVWVTQSSNKPSKGEKLYKRAEKKIDLSWKKKYAKTRTPNRMKWMYLCTEYQHFVDSKLVFWILYDESSYSIRIRILIPLLLLSTVSTGKQCWQIKKVSCVLRIIFVCMSKHVRIYETHAIRRDFAWQNKREIY